MHRASLRFGLLLLATTVGWTQSPEVPGQPPPPADDSRQAGARRGARIPPNGNIAGPDAEVQANAAQANVAQARDLLERSYMLGGTLPLHERVKVLPRQIFAATSIAPDLAASWAEDSLAFAGELPEGSDRASIYGAAIPVLAEKDLLRALEVFHSMPAEDVSALVSPTSGSPGFVSGIGTGTPLSRLFSRVVREKGQDGLEWIKQEAQRLAQSDHYPYSAVVDAARQLQRRQDAAASQESLFPEMLAAYQQGMRSRASDSDFANMLLREWRRMPKTVAGEALSALVANTVAQAEQDVTASQSEQSSSVAADNRLLSRLISLAKDQPELQKRIVEAQKSLANVVGPTSFAGGIGSGMGQPQAFQPWNQARRNPEQTLTASGAITDPLARTLALAAAAGGMMSRNREGATSALDQAGKSAEQIEDPIQRLQASVAIAGAAARMGNESAMRTSLDRGLSAAEQLQDGDAQAYQQAESGLRNLVRTVAMQNSALALSYIELVRQPELKASLLIDAAMAVYRPQRRPGNTPPDFRR